MTSIDKQRRHAFPPFRLAIVGAGLITRNTHLPTALSLPGVEVTAIVDPVVDRAVSLTQDYGIRARALDSVTDLGGLCDGAIVATPNHTHCDIAVPLLEVGISTLIEKPMATTVEEGERILEAARCGKAQVGIGHYQRFLDAPRLLKRLLAEGHFGRLSRFYHQFGTPGGWAAMSSYTLRRSAIGGGVLVVTGTHFLDRMLDMWGMPDEVGLHDDARDGPEAHCEGWVSYRDAGPGPIEGQVRYSKCVPLPAGLVLESERGIVMLRDGSADRITLFARGRDDLRHEIVCGPDADFPPGFDASQRMLWDFVNACAERRAPLVDGRQGLASIELIRRFYQHRQPLTDNWVQFQGVGR